MNRQQAHDLLDEAKRGKELPEAEITAALRATGDLAHSWPTLEREEDDWPQIRIFKPAGSWERRYAAHLAPAQWLAGVA